MSINKDSDGNEYGFSTLITRINSLEVIKLVLSKISLLLPFQFIPIEHQTV
jgi:hypothetical protein